MLAADFKAPLSPPIDMSDESLATFVLEVAKLAARDARHHVHASFAPRLQLLGQALERDDLAAIREHHTRLSELMSRLRDS
jgi:hypothetical protein